MTKEINTKPKKRKLTKKQRGFVKDYAIEENGTKAALNHYDIKGKDKRVIAANVATENLSKPYIVEAIENERMTLKQALIKQGITENRIAEKVDVLLNAQKKTFRNNVTTGEIEEVGVEPDYTAIDKGLKHATVIYGITPEGTSKSSNITYNFLFSADTQQKINAINQEIKAKLINNESNKQN